MNNGLTRGGGALFFSTELAQFPMPGPLRQLVTCAQARCQLAGDGSVCQLSGVQPLDPTDSIHQSSPGQLRTQLRERDREREGERLSRRGAHAGFNLKLRRESATCFQTAADFFLWVLGQFALRGPLRARPANLATGGAALAKACQSADAAETSKFAPTLRAN